MFHRQATGSSPDFWRDTWSDGAFEEALRFCDVDPLKPLFLRYAPPGTLMLEGGCGLGQYVAYNAARGVRAVGFDFERQALGTLRDRRPDLLLCAGDVAHLPLASGVFDVYYSGGVVEHFEEGPEASLREARRVLRPGGFMLVSVPYLSPLRRLLARGLRDDWQRLSRPAVTPSPASFTFFQYAFTPREFRKVLEHTGFDVVSTQAYAILWGLLDVPGCAGMLNRLRSPRAYPQADGHAPGVEGGGEAAPRARSLVKRLVVNEDASIPLAGALVRLVGWAAANMMMYVCVSREETQGPEG